MDSLPADVTEWPENSGTYRWIPMGRHALAAAGEVTRQWRRFGSLIEKEVGMGFLGGRPPRVRPAEGDMARLRGAVALVLQKHFGPSAGGHEEEDERFVRGKAIA